MEAELTRARSRRVLASLLVSILVFGALCVNASAVSVLTVQKRLASKGYLSSRYITGKKNSHTMHSLKVFQIMNGLTASGSLTKTTYKRLVSKKAIVRRSVIGESASDTVYSAFKKKKNAVIVDLVSGWRMRVRRVGGTNHLDVEPAYASDTKKLKRLYKGYSWDSRAVVLIAGGKYYAGAINFYPHGAQLSKKNGFKGHFCLHVYGSTTHGTEVTNTAHQANVRKVIDYFKAA